MNEKIHKAWVEAKLSEIISILESGNRPKGGVRGIKSGIPSLGGEHLNSNGGFNFENIKYVPIFFYNRMKKGHIKLHDILIVKDGATTGKTSFVSSTFPFKRAVVNEHVFLLRCSKEIFPSFIYRYLWSEEGQRKILANFQGAAQGGITRKFINNVIVPLPPLNEQKRIVAKLDTIMPRVEAVKERLERIPLLIKRFRQAVLTAAVTGKLTEKWREQHPDVESAKVLLDKLQEEREKKYKEECEKAKKEGKKKPAKLNDFIYGVVFEPYFKEIETWVYTCLGNIVYDFKYGTSEKSDKQNSGSPVIRIPNILSKYIDFTDLKFLKTTIVNENNKVSKGDILLVRSNGSRELVGRNCIVQELKTNTAFASYLIRIRPFVINSEYIYILLNTPVIREQFFSKAKSSAGINNINTKELSKTLVPLPPLEEQEEIVRQVDKLFAFADKLEAHYQKAKEKILKLPQSILAKAYRGELVPQDPKEEPAHILLEKIKAQKENKQKLLRGVQGGGFLEKSPPGRRRQKNEIH